MADPLLIVVCLAVTAIIAFSVWAACPPSDRTIGRAVHRDEEDGHGLDRQSATDHSAPPPNTIAFRPPNTIAISLCCAVLVLALAAWPFLYEFNKEPNAYAYAFLAPLSGLSLIIVWTF
jgi:hypothetical protein